MNVQAAPIQDPFALERIERAQLQDMDRKPTVTTRRWMTSAEVSEVFGQDEHGAWAFRYGDGAAVTLWYEEEYRCVRVRALSTEALHRTTELLDDVKGRDDYEGIRTCPTCGFSYCPGLAEDRETHRQEHRRQLQIQAAHPAYIIGYRHYEALKDTRIFGSGTVEHTLNTCRSHWCRSIDSWGDDWTEHPDLPAYRRAWLTTTAPHLGTPEMIEALRELYDAKASPHMPPGKSYWEPEPAWDPTAKTAETAGIDRISERAWLRYRDELKAGQLTAQSS